MSRHCERSEAIQKWREVYWSYRWRKLSNIKGTPHNHVPILIIWL